MDDKVLQAVVAAVAALDMPGEEVFAVVGPDVPVPEPTDREVAANVARLAAGVALGALTGVAILSQRECRAPAASRFVVVTNQRLLLFAFKGVVRTVPRELVGFCPRGAIWGIRTNAELTAAVLTVAGLDVGLAMHLVLQPAEGPPRKDQCSPWPTPPSHSAWHPPLCTVAHRRVHRRRAGHPRRPVAYPPDRPCARTVRQRHPRRLAPMLEATLALGVSRLTVLQRVKRGELQAVRVRSGRRKGLRINLPNPTNTLF